MTYNEAQTYKPCPFCGEEILESAIKCKHCGEFLTEAAAPQAAQPPVVVKTKEGCFLKFMNVGCVTMVIIAVLLIIGIGSLLILIANA